MDIYKDIAKWDFIRIKVHESGAEWDLMGRSKYAGQNAKSFAYLKKMYWFSEFRHRRHHYYYSHFFLSLLFYLLRQS